MLVFWRGVTTPTPPPHLHTHHHRFPFCPAHTFCSLQLPTNWGIFSPLHIYNFLHCPAFPFHAFAFLLHARTHARLPFACYTALCLLAAHCTATSPTFICCFLHLPCCSLCLLLPLPACHLISRTFTHLYFSLHFPVIRWSRLGVLIVPFLITLPTHAVVLPTPVIWFPIDFGFTSPPQVQVRRALYVPYWYSVLWWYSIVVLTLLMLLLMMMIWLPHCCWWCAYLLCTTLSFAPTVLGIPPFGILFITTYHLTFRYSDDDSHFCCYCVTFTVTFPICIVIYRCCYPPLPVVRYSSLLLLVVIAGIGICWCCFVDCIMTFLLLPCYQYLTTIRPLIMRLNHWWGKGEWWVGADGGQWGRNLRIHPCPCIFMSSWPRHCQLWTFGLPRRRRKEGKPVTYTYIPCAPVMPSHVASMVFLYSLPHTRCPTSIWQERGMAAFL